MPRPKKAKQQRRAALAVYLPPALLEELRDVAEKEYRSASTQALIFIKRSLDERKV